MRELGIVAAGFGWVTAVVLGVALFAFPQTNTVTVTKKVVPYRSWIKASSESSPISNGIVATCDYYENRKGITKGTVPPKVTDRIVIECYASKGGGAAS